MRAGRCAATVSYGNTTVGTALEPVRPLRWYNTPLKLARQPLRILGYGEESPGSKG